MLSDIGAIIVTFNRLEKLKKALESYECQTLLPKYIIVVNNASNDGTKEYLEIWKKENSEYEKIVVSLSENKGGAGGFYEGQKLAITKDADWIMHADDDLYLDKDYFFKFNEYMNNNNDYNDCSIICGKVLYKKKVSLGDRCILKNKWTIPFFINVDEHEYKKEKFYCDFVSFLAVAINKNKLIKAGLVKYKYFIWFDDFEFSYRIGQLGKIICIPELSADHDREDVKNLLTWKLYYLYRNQTDFIKCFFKFQFIFLVIIMVLKAICCPLKGKSFMETKMRLQGIKDGILGKFGKHLKYCPGWKYKKL